MNNTDANFYASQSENDGKNVIREGCHPYITFIIDIPHRVKFVEKKFLAPKIFDTLV